MKGLTPDLEVKKPILSLTVKLKLFYGYNND